MFQVAGAPRVMRVRKFGDRRISLRLGGHFNGGFPRNSRKMCDWPVVQTVDGAPEALKCLSQSANIYVATGAEDSSESEIKRAFSRVGLDEFLSGYFCKSNVGLAKGSPGFLEVILSHLGLPASRTAVVGDSFVKDMKPAMRLGLKPIWLTQENAPRGTEVRVIRN